MMKTFIVAVPLFDMNMAVEAYRLCDQNGEKLFGTAQDYQEMGEALRSPGLDLVEKVGIEPFTGGKKLFVDVNQYLLVMGIPANMHIDPTLLVCILPKDTPLDETVLRKCAEFKEMGMQFALEGKEYAPELEPLFDMADYVIYDTGYVDFSQNVITLRSKYPEKKLLISNVPDMQSFEQYSTIPDSLFEGKFYNQPLTEGETEMSPLKANALQLLRMVNEDDDFDFTPIVRIVERDPSISLSLLRFINSPAVGVRQRIDSIRNAVAILGQRELKRWVTVAVSVQLATDKPTEITKLSLVRAKFAENLAEAYGIQNQSASLFLCGLFSLLDVVLDRPMEEAIEEVAVDDAVKEALVEKKGDMHKIMDLIYAYERANWDHVAVNMIRNDIDIDQINQGFVDALVWYKELLEEI